jgi:hypothetical protein
MRTIVGIVAVGVAIVAAADSLPADQGSVADAARKISGSWAFNRDISPQFAQPARGRGGRGGLRFQGAGSAVPVQPRYPQGIKANPTNTEPTSSEAGDLTPAELAERNALRVLGQVPPMITVVATPEHVTISDDHGDVECDVNGKAAKARFFTTYMDVKCRWDRNQLRQEIANTRSKLVRVWAVDERELLKLTLKVEGIDRNTPEAVAFYDRVR